MRRLTEDDVMAAPLPPGPLEAWHSYVAYRQRGLRREALAAVHRFVDRLDPDTRTGFARWVCTLLFDESDFWSGQWYGGTEWIDADWNQPVAPVLFAHPITAGITMPYLMSSMASPDSRHLRWMYQFTVGRSYHLPPPEQQRWEEALETRFGPGMRPIDLLRLAHHDAVARRMLRDAEAGLPSPCHPWPV